MFFSEQSQTVKCPRSKAKSPENRSGSFMFSRINPLKNSFRDQEDSRCIQTYPRSDSEQYKIQEEIELKSNVIGSRVSADTP